MVARTAWLVIGLLALGVIGTAGVAPVDDAPEVSLAPGAEAEHCAGTVCDCMHLDCNPLKELKIVRGGP